MIQGSGGSEGNYTTKPGTGGNPPPAVTQQAVCYRYTLTINNPQFVKAYSSGALTKEAYEAIKKDAVNAEETKVEISGEEDEYYVIIKQP